MTFAELPWTPSESYQAEGRTQRSNDMGCDIHSWCEIRKNGKWEIVTEGFDNRDGTMKDGRWVLPSNPIFWRHYDVFSILAGVRSREKYPAIYKPRGVPEDATKDYLTEVEKWDVDAHSHSWHSLRHLMESVKENWPNQLTERTIPQMLAILDPEAVQFLPAWKEGILYGLQDWLAERGKSLDDIRIVFFFDN